jgi:hypothetical protein
LRRWRACPVCLTLAFRFLLPASCAPGFGLSCGAGRWPLHPRGHRPRLPHVVDRCNRRRCSACRPRFPSPPSRPLRPLPAVTTRGTSPSGRAAPARPGATRGASPPGSHPRARHARRHQGRAGTGRLARGSRAGPLTPRPHRRRPGCGAAREQRVAGDLWRPPVQEPAHAGGWCVDGLFHTPSPFFFFRLPPAAC